MFPVYGSTQAAPQPSPQSQEPAVVMYEPDLENHFNPTPAPEPKPKSYHGAIQSAHNKIQHLATVVEFNRDRLEESVRRGQEQLANGETPPTLDQFEEFAARVGVKDGYTAQEVSDDKILADVEKTYSTAQAAAFFPSKKKNPDGSPKDMSNQWMYWGLKNNLFVDIDGKPITPLRVGKRSRFTLEQIEAIALSWHRRGNLSLDELKIVLRRILIARHGMSSFDQESTGEA